MKRVLEPSEILNIRSIAQTERHPEKTSERYGFIPTMDIAKTLGEFNLVPVSARESRTRSEENKGYQKHVIRFRFADQVGTLNVDDEVPEIVLVNSHMGSASFELLLGMFRCVCSNQLVVKSSSLAEYRIRHNKDAIELAAQAVQQITHTLPEITERVAEFKSIALSDQEREIFAQTAIPFRFDEEKQEVLPSSLLRKNRYADSAPTLWNTYNTVQENMIKGGVRVYDQNKSTFHRGRRSKEVKSIDQNLKINTALWALTERMAELKRA